MLGELSASERAEVEKNLATYAELKVELTRLEEVQENFLMKRAVTPSASVKAKVFGRIQSNPAGRSVVMPQQDSKSSFWKLAAAASIAVALGASYLAFNYYGKWQDTETDLSELIAQNQRIAQDYNTVNQRLDKIETDLQITNNPAFSRVIMAGTANAPEALASVYWNASTKEIYLSVQNMKVLAQENQYQLWAIVDGKPVDAGVFDALAEGLLKMKNLEGATAFAVTIEPRGGKPTPSLETMQVIGNVVKG